MTGNRVSEIVDNDVISSSTPLEMELAGVHPRLHTTAARIKSIRQRKDERPYCYILASSKRAVEALAETPLLAAGDSGEPIRLANFQAPGVDKREYGDRIYRTAGYYVLSGDTGARDQALQIMRALAAYEDWGTSLGFGHWAHGMACGIDWLWDEIDPAERDYFLDILLKHTERLFDAWSSYRSGEPFGYTWNIMGVILGGFGAAAGVLYGERPDIARFINLLTEKARASAHALGDDGVSPEGMAYGGYYVTFMTLAFTFVRDLVGVDLFQVCDWYRAFPSAIYHHTISRNAWEGGAQCFQFGDAHHHRTRGCDALLDCAKAYGDGFAQWLAGELASTVPGRESGDPLTAFKYDPGVQAAAPQDEPTLMHFRDMDIAIGRTDWSGDESVFAVKCGASAGRKGVAQYPNPLAGGHMQPSAGVLQVFSHGQWILAHPDYTWKHTSYHNCLIVDGASQEGGDSEWFEDLAFRQGAPSPRLLRVTATDWGHYVLANPAPAYRKSSGVNQYYRHVFFIKPDCWVVVDAIRLRRPATPEVLWHTLTPLSEREPNVFSTTNDTAATRVTVLCADGLACSTEEQTILHSSRYEVDPRQLLRIKPTAPATEQIFVTAIETSPAGESPKTSVTCDCTDTGLTINILGPSPLQLPLDPWCAT